MDKQSDIGHAKRSLGAKLRDTKTRNRQCKQLTQSVIQHVEKMLSYALRNNKNDPNDYGKLCCPSFHMHVVTIPPAATHGVATSRIQRRTSMLVFLMVKT